MLLDYGVVLLLTAALMVVFAFLGCDGNLFPKGSQGPGFPAGDFTSVICELKYDPNALVNNAKIDIERVDFVIHRDGGGKTVDSTQTIAPDGLHYDFTAWPVGVASSKFLGSPQWGHYLLGLGIPSTGLIPTRWKVWCNAFRQATDKDPTYRTPDAAAIEKRVEDPGRSYSFVFTLGPNGQIGERAVDVVLSYVYTGAAAKVSKVIFYVALDTLPEVSLTITPPNVATPNPLFTGTTVSDVLGAPQNTSGTWHATVKKAPLGQWTVRCEGYTDRPNVKQPEFEQGGSITKDVSGADASYLFDFEIRNRKTEPIPH